MHLIRPEIARSGIQGVKSPEEWPYYLKFVGLISFDCVAIGPATGLLHGDLLLWIRIHVEAVSGQRLQLKDVDVFDGYVECENDGSMVIRTMAGRALRPEIEAAIRQLLEGMLKI